MEPEGLANIKSQESCLQEACQKPGILFPGNLSKAREPAKNPGCLPKEKPGSMPKDMNRASKKLVKSQASCFQETCQRPGNLPKIQDACQKSQGACQKLGIVLPRSWSKARYPALRKPAKSQGTCQKEIQESRLQNVREYAKIQESCLQEAGPKPGILIL